MTKARANLKDVSTSALAAREGGGDDVSHRELVCSKFSTQFVQGQAE